MINLFGSPPNLYYDAVVDTLYTISNTRMPKSPSESVDFPLSRIQRKNMFVNELLAKATMVIVEESEVHILVQQQLINVFSDNVAKKEELAHAYGRHPH